MITVGTNYEDKLELDESGGSTRNTLPDESMAIHLLVMRDAKGLYRGIRMIYQRGRETLTKYAER